MDSTMQSANTRVDNGKEALADGRSKIDWARSNMAMLRRVAKEFSENRPFDGITIGVSLHIEQKTAVLLMALYAGGAKVVATGNLGTTQDDIGLALRESGVTVFGRRDDSKEEHLENVRNVLRRKPVLLLDNGADLVQMAVREAEFSTDGILGGTEETTSGGLRLRTELADEVPFPVIVINDSPLKLVVENKHGVGQSIVESFSRITNLLPQGKRVAVFGYGWCGRGIAKYFRAVGAQVSVVEPDAITGVEACVDGYSLMTAEEAARWATVIVTATGQPNVLRSDHFDQMQDGVIIGNAGHFDWEIDLPALKGRASTVESTVNGVERYTMTSGKSILLLCSGRMFNLGGRDPKGNTIECMDMGFTLQALSLQSIARRSSGLVAGAQPVPNDVNYDTATRMLACMNVPLPNKLAPTNEFLAQPLGR